HSPIEYPVHRIAQGIVYFGIEIFRPHPVPGNQVQSIHIKPDFFCADTVAYPRWEPVSDFCIFQANKAADFEEECIGFPFANRTSQAQSGVPDFFSCGCPLCGPRIPVTVTEIVRAHGTIPGKWLRHVAYSLEQKRHIEITVVKTKRPSESELGDV